MEEEFSENKFIGKGWSFPPTFNTSRKGVEMTEGNEDIQRSLEILLTTMKGERVMQPKYGCNMDEMIFQPLDTTTKTIIRDKIRIAILYFESRIDLVNIQFDFSKEQEGEVLIRIEYTIRGTNSRFNYVFPFYENEGTELN